VGEGNGKTSETNDLEVRKLFCASCSKHFGYILLEENEIESGVFCIDCMDDDDVEDLFSDD
jgi:hypothetical protein